MRSNYFSYKIRIQLHLSIAPENQTGLVWLKLNMATGYNKLGLLDEAEKICDEQLQEIESHRSSPLVSRTGAIEIWLLRAKAINLQARWRMQLPRPCPEQSTLLSEAASLFRRVHTNSFNAMGVSQRLTWASLRELSDSLWALNRYREADELIERCLEALLSQKPHMEGSNRRVLGAFLVYVYYKVSGPTSYKSANSKKVVELISSASEMFDIPLNSIDTIGQYRLPDRLNIEGVEYQRSGRFAEAEIAGQSK